MQGRSKGCLGEGRGAEGDDTRFEVGVTIQPREERDGMNADADVKKRREE